MIAEDIEFQISQYADGTLSVAERASVDTLLNADPEARQILAEYQKLDSQLARLRVPDIRWDKLAGHISDVIEGADASAPAVAGRIGWTTWSSRIRIAASVVIVVGAGFLARHTIHHPVIPQTTAPDVSDVSGPSADIARGNPSEEISVGPSALAQSQAASHNVQNAIVPGPSRVIINEAIATPTKDKRHPH